MKIAIIMGTRPEIIKMSPIIARTKKSDSVIIFSGQHYDYEMGMRFIEELGIRTPDYSLKLGKTDPASQIGEMMIKLSKITQDEKFDAVLIQGDTNTVLAGAISSLKNHTHIGHVEAGIRSYDWRMPEEHNRIVADHVSDTLFAPTYNNKKNLLQEKVHGDIFVTGNTIIDVVEKFAPISKTNIVTPDNFILLTLHRAENVDDKNTLTRIMKGILDSKSNVLFPVHPRTQLRLRQFGLYEKLKRSHTVILTGPVSYLEMLDLMKRCLFVITDSGGIQEETTSPKIRKKVLVLREKTDRPEAVNAGISKMVGTESNMIAKAIAETIKDPVIHTSKSPYGKGNASEVIIKIMKELF